MIRSRPAERGFRIRIEGMAFLLPHFEYDVFVSYSHGAMGRKSDAPLLRLDA